MLLVGTLAYVALVLLLRISGKRTLTKLNAFDLVVTVALGSTLATVLLSKSVALAEGVLALALLICLQYAITWLSVRSPRFQALVKAEPTLLVHRGRFLDGAMRGPAHHPRGRPRGAARERRRRGRRGRGGGAGDRRLDQRDSECGPGRRPERAGRRRCAVDGASPAARRALTPAGGSGRHADVIPTAEAGMQYVEAHGVRIPALGFGTFRLEGAVARRMVGYALEIGYRHIDTAQMYGNEAEVGAGDRGVRPCRATRSG